MAEASSSQNLSSNEEENSPFDETIGEKILKVLEHQTKILEKINISPQKDSSHLRGFEFPLASVDALNNLERTISNSSEAKDELVKLFESCTDVKEAVKLYYKLMLAKLMSDGLSSEFTGRNKKNFSNNNGIFAAMKECMGKKNAENYSDATVIEEALKDAFTRAANRFQQTRMKAKKTSGVPDVGGMQLTEPDASTSSKPQD